MSNNLFDFTDMTDLPDALVKRLSGPSGAVNPNIDIFASIVEAGAKAGAGSLSISQIEAVAWKMKLENIPAQQSIRNALNAAVKANRLVKPTRQTYGVKGTQDDDNAETPTPVVLQAVPAAVEAAPVDETDPLA
jgi:hypothetical protein